MKTTVSALWAAVIKAALQFVPLPYRWAVRLVADAFQQKAAAMGAAALEEPVEVSGIDSLKVVIQGIFDMLGDAVKGRPLISAAVRIVGKFVVENLTELVYDFLFNGGKSAAMGTAATGYQPASAEALTRELDAAVEAE